MAEVDFGLSPSRRDGLRQNLEAIAAWGHPRLATPGARRAAARSVFRSYHRGFVEYLSHREGGPGARFQGAEKLYRALAPGRGAVVAAPHLGNWELAALALARLGFRVHVVTGLQYHASVAGAVRGAKESARIQVSTPEDGFLPLLATLRAGGLVLLLADGDVYARGVPARLFGAGVELPPGPALLARRAGAPIVHAHAVRERDGSHRIVFESVDHPDRSLAVADDVARLTEGVARALERVIAANVTQWCIFRPLLAAPREASQRSARALTHAA
jgi:phosphatidylinositol dimannoside acyltransferase